MPSNLRFVPAGPAGEPQLDVEIASSSGYAFLRIPRSVLAEFCILKSDKPEHFFLAFDDCRDQLWPQMRRLASALRNGDLYVIARQDLYKE